MKDWLFAIAFFAAIALGIADSESMAVFYLSKLGALAFTGLSFWLMR